MANPNESINQRSQSRLRNSDTNQQQSFQHQFDPTMIASYGHDSAVYRLPFTSHNGQNDFIFSRHDESETSLRNSYETIPNNPIPAVFTSFEAPSNAMQYQMYVSNIPSKNPENESSEGDSESSSILDMSNSS